MVYVCACVCSMTRLSSISQCPLSWLCFYSVVYRLASSRFHVQRHIVAMQCLAYWDRIKGAERWSPDWSLRALAAAQRVQLSLSAFADNIYGLVQPHAESFK